MCASCDRRGEGKEAAADAAVFAHALSAVPVLLRDVREGQPGVPTPAGAETRSERKGGQLGGVAFAAVGTGNQATKECLGEKLLVTVEPQHAPCARSDG